MCIRDSSRIFQFGNFDRTRKRVLADLKKERKGKEDEDGDISVGTYIVVHIKEVPRHLYNEWYHNGPSKQPLVLFNILPHEQKMCVLNFVMKRTKSENYDDVEDVIKSNVMPALEGLERNELKCLMLKSQEVLGQNHGISNTLEKMVDSPGLSVFG